MRYCKMGFMGKLSIRMTYNDSVLAAKFIDLWVSSHSERGNIWSNLTEGV